ncbi:hypothetical protein [Campylobacter concisus]|nr:hypothetical protein [Campylobacter concisus]
MISYRIFAKQGDLLTAKADFAVNPSNTAMLAAYRWHLNEVVV